MFERSESGTREKFKLAKAVRKANRRNGVAFLVTFLARQKFTKKEVKLVK